MFDSLESLEKFADRYRESKIDTLNKWHKDDMIQAFVDGYVMEYQYAQEAKKKKKYREYEQHIHALGVIEWFAYKSVMRGLFVGSGWEDKVREKIGNSKYI